MIITIKYENKIAKLHNTQLITNKTLLEKTIKTKKINTKG